jgi:hypothetical protein
LEVDLNQQTITKIDAFCNATGKRRGEIIDMMVDFLSDDQTNFLELIQN